MLLQAYDFAELYRRDGVTLQVGGSDQWGNITAGTTLVRKLHGAEAHGVTLPLLTTSDGAKFGKSESGAIWLDAARTSPYQFYQFWIGADDRDVSRYLRTFTLLDRAEIEALDRATAAAPEKREAQQLLARTVTAMIHGVDAAQTATEVSTLLFAKGDPADVVVRGARRAGARSAACDGGAGDCVRHADAVRHRRPQREQERRASVAAAGRIVGEWCQALGRRHVDPVRPPAQRRVPAAEERRARLRADRRSRLSACRRAQAAGSYS